MNNFTVNDPAKTGQANLLAEPPCDCDGLVVTTFQKHIATIAHGIKMPRRVCVVARAVALGLVGAGFVNPINVRPEDRDECKRAALIVADAYEEIARGIRRRVGS